MKVFFILLAVIAITIIIINVFHIRNSDHIPRIVYVPWLPNPRRAMTIPPFGIFMLKKYKDETKWIHQHEQVHWKQYQKLGLWKFYFIYYRELIKNGYFNNALEIEAREKGGWEDKED